MNSYTAGKICSALHALAAGPGTLPERVKEANGYLSSCTDIQGFEKYFETICENLHSVKAGDYSKVTRPELQCVVSAIEEMAYEIARRDKVTKK